MRKPRVIKRVITGYKCKYTLYLTETGKTEEAVSYLPYVPNSFKDYLMELQNNFGDVSRVVIIAEEPVPVTLECTLSVVDLLNSGLADITVVNEPTSNVDGGEF